MIQVIKKTEQFEGKTLTHYWYVVKAPNNKILVSSEVFKTKQACMKSVYSLLEVLRDKQSKVVDLTKK